MNTALQAQPTESHISVVPTPKAQESIDYAWNLLDRSSKTNLSGCIYNELPSDIKTVIFAIARHRHEGDTLKNARVETPLHEFEKSERLQILLSINDLVDSLQGLAHISIDKFK